MLLKETAYLAEAIGRGLKAEHFSEPLHADIYGAAKSIWLKGEHVDLATVTRLVGFSKADDVMRVYSWAPLTQNFSPYLQAVLDWSKQTEIFARLREVSHVMTNRRPMDSLSPVVERIGELLTFCQGTAESLRTFQAREAVDQSLTQARERVELVQSGKRVAGITTGFAALDKTIYGFQPGFVYVLGARTAVGKTTLAVNMALAAAEAGHKTAFVTVEMAAADIVDKMLSRHGRVHMGRFLSGHVSADEGTRIEHAGVGVAALPLLITEVINPKLDDLTFELMRLVKADGVKLVVLDYLQLFEMGDGRFRPAREEAKEVSKRIKSLARSLDVPILVLSQLNRLAPEEGQPELTHIAESDQIARDADVVLLLYRAGQSHFLSIAKHRRGVRKAFRIDAELHFNLFTEGAEVTR